FAILADNLAAAGFLPLVDDVIVHTARLCRFLAAIKTRPVFMAILAPDIIVAARRDEERAEKHVFRRWAHLDAIMRDEMAGLGCWIDSSDLTPAETAAEVLARVWRDGLITS